MALKYVDNFGFWTTTPGTLQAVRGTAAVASGKLSLSNSTGGASISNYITAQGTYVFNARINVETAPNGSPSLGAANFVPLFWLFDGADGQCGISISDVGKFQFYRGQNPPFAVAVGPSSIQSVIFDAGTTYYDIETKLVIGNSGTVQAKLNGGDVISSTTVDNQNTANATADSTRLREGISGSSTLTGAKINFEHHIIMDGTGSALNGNFLGPVDVTLLPPTGDGFYTEWAVTNPPNVRWQAVDDADPDEDTSYIFSATVGQRNLFTHGNLPAASTAVKATAVWARARRDDATTRAFKILLRNATPTDNLGGVEHFCGDNYIWFFQPYEVNPFTAAAWTVAEVNAVQYGQQVTV